MNEKIKLELKIYKFVKQEYIPINCLIINNKINYKNNKYITDCLFEPFFLNNNYISLTNEFKDINKNKTLKFIKSFFLYPHFTLIRQGNSFSDQWQFVNIFNIYFCFCEGLNCFKYSKYQKCKYYFYLN